MPDKARIIFVRQRNGDFIAEPDFRNVKSRGAEITGSLFRGSFFIAKNSFTVKISIHRHIEALLLL